MINSRNKLTTTYEIGTSPAEPSGVKYKRLTESLIFNKQENHA